MLALGARVGMEGSSGTDQPPAQASRSLSSPGCQAPAPPAEVELYGWGANEAGQLGLGEGAPEEVAVPRRVEEAVRGRDVLDVAAGSQHTAVVTGETLQGLCNLRGCAGGREDWPGWLAEPAGAAPWPAADGELYLAGSNDAGQLGLRGLAQAPAFARVAALEHCRVGLAACGSAHTLAVAADGAAFGWGDAEWGQLGLGPTAGTQVCVVPGSRCRGTPWESQMP